MQITYLGHSAIYVETEQAAILIDPFLTGNPQAALQPTDIKRLTHILVTHGHGDHVGDTVALAKAHDALVITNYELALHLEQAGIQVHPMHIGGRTTFDFGTLKMTSALHGSGIETETGILEGGTPGGFVVTIEGQTLYHAGDTGLTLDMQLLKEESVDVAFLPIGGNFTMDSHDACRAVGFIQPKKVVPIHYNTFRVIAADPQAFRDAVKAAGHPAEVVILGSGDKMILED